MASAVPGRYGASDEGGSVASEGNEGEETSHQGEPVMVEHIVIHARPPGNVTIYIDEEHKKYAVWIGGKRTAGGEYSSIERLKYEEVKKA